MEEPKIYKTVNAIRDATSDMVDNGYKIKTPRSTVGKTKYAEWLEELEDLEDNKVLKVSIVFNGKNLVLTYL